jgi:sortase A
MKFKNWRPLHLSAHTHRLVRWSRGLLFSGGIIALAYVGLTLLDARLYQADATHSLETQIRTRTGPKGNQLQPTVKVKEGDILGRMDIPRLGVSVVVLQGTSSRMLHWGAGHIEGTPLPGYPGNSGIAGHRDTFFRKLKDIRRNDRIQIQTATELLHYEVDWVKVVEPNDTSVLQPSTVASTLTLVTCYPFQFLGAAPRRFVVHARKD